MTILANMTSAQQAELASAVTGAQRSTQSGAFTQIGSWYRLAFKGTGTAQIDVLNLADEITTNVVSYTLTDAVNQIEYPYFGDDAKAIRPTLTGTVTMKVL